LTQLVEWIAAPILEQQLWEEEQQQQQQQQQVLPASTQAVGSGTVLPAAPAALAAPERQAAGIGKVPLPGASAATLQQPEKIDDASTAAAAEALAAAVAAYVDASAASSTAADAAAHAGLDGSSADLCAAPAPAAARMGNYQVTDATAAAAAAAAASTAASPAAPHSAGDSIDAGMAANSSNPAAVMQQQVDPSRPAPSSTATASLQQQQLDEEEDLDVPFNACLDMLAAPAHAASSTVPASSSDGCSRSPAVLQLPGATASRDSSSCRNMHGLTDSLDGASGLAAGCYAEQQVRVRFSRFENRLFSGEDPGDNI
jgi:hypothetical protein